MIIQGIDPSNQAKPLLVDASGNVIVSASQLTTTGGKLHLDADGDLYVEVAGGRLALPTAVFAQYTNTALPAGSSTWEAYEVPTNTVIRTVTSSCRYVGTVAGVSLTIQVKRSGTAYIIERITNLENGKFYQIRLGFIMEAGDSIEVIVVNATLNDDVNVNVFAEKIN